MTICPKCGKENPDGFRFCGFCSSPLVVEDAAFAEVRKIVTIVFCDVTGSTDLGERLDPETTRRVMSRYFAEMRTILERHGGTVEKFIGDAVMAVFGIPRLREDDALRAVRAAHEMQQRLGELNNSFETEQGVRLQVRTGVNTGEVVAGDSSSQQSFASGDAVNVAARLEQAAAPGQILLGERTWRLVKDAADAEAVEPLELKGKGGRVAAFRLLRIGMSTARSAGRLHSPMVGREGERQLLEQAYGRAVRERSCILFTILGSAGVGKSRLVGESVDLLRSEASILQGTCLSYGEGITFWPVVEVVRAAVGITDEDSIQEARLRIRSLLDGMEIQDVVADRVAEVIGLGTSSTSPEELFWGIRRFLEAIASERPLILVFDDIHWAEPSLLDLIEHIADWSRDAAILLVCIARQDLLDLRPGWGGGKLNATSILLEVLRQEECERLIVNLLGTEAIDSHVRERILESAEGNPLFVEEMFSMLVDEGLLENSEGRWVASSDLSTVALPPTIQALVAARLDLLETKERQVIERAAIAGQVFHSGAIWDLASDSLRPDISNRLLSLVRKELIRPATAEFAGEEAFRFRHHLILEVAYEAMPKEERATLHERFAAWLEKIVGERVDEYEPILGYHLEQAYRYRSELGPLDDHARELAARAAALLGGAARRARTRGDVPGARSLFERACSLSIDRPAERLELLPGLGEALYQMGESDAGDAIFSELIDGARELGDRGVELRAFIQRERSLLEVDSGGNWEEDRARAAAVVPLLDQLDDKVALASAWLVMGVLDLQMGNATVSREELERSMAYARESGDRLTEIEAMGWLAVSLPTGPIPLSDTDRLFDEMSARGGDALHNEAYVSIFRGQTSALRGEFAEAHDYIERGRALLLDLGQRRGWAITAMVSGQAELLAGDAETAESKLREALRVLEEMKGREYGATLAFLLGEALLRQGRFDEADEMASACRSLALAGDWDCQSGWRLVRAKVLARRGDFIAAERLGREAIAFVPTREVSVHQLQVAADLAEILILCGRNDQVADLVGPALRLAEQKGATAFEAKLQSLLEEAGSPAQLG
jgi:class 3 adenylate cyclase/tetratricopeptide (TPR) repeat protein